MKLVPKGEFCCEGKENYIQKLISFNLQGKSYLAIARKSGFVQLYENVHEATSDKDTKRGRKSYKLCKDWKHSNMNTNDQIIDIGFLDERYLYSCSNEGKLVFRDLINDDANESYMVFLIQKPVNCFAIRCMENEFGEPTGSYTVACAGKNNELKLYSILLEKASTSPQDADISRGYYLTGNNGGLLDNENNVADDRNTTSAIGNNEDEVVENEEEEAESEVESEVDSEVESEDHEFGNQTEGVVDSDVDEVVLVSFHPVLPIIQFSRDSTGSNRGRNSTYVDSSGGGGGRMPFSAFMGRPHSYNHYAEIFRRHRTSTNLHSFASLLNERKVKTLIPNWSSRTAYKDYVYTASLPDKAFNWFVSITFVPGKPEIILCGNQFGDLFVYNTSRSKFPVKKTNLSQFSITKIQIFENNNCQYIIYTDSMSRIGILNFHTFQQVNCFDGIKMGPISSSFFIFSPPSNQTMNYKRKLHKYSSFSTFDPIVFITSTIEKKLLIYKLYNDNTKQLVGEIITDSLIPSICFNGRGIDDIKVYEKLAGTEKSNLRGDMLNLERYSSTLTNKSGSRPTNNAVDGSDSSKEDEADMFNEGELEVDYKKRNSRDMSSFDFDMVEVNSYSVKKPSPLRYGFTSDEHRSTE